MARDALSPVIITDACSTMPSYCLSVAMALWIDTGLPMRMAEASVGLAVIGSKFQLFVYAR